MVNLFGILCTKFYQNQPSVIEDTTETFSGILCISPVDVKRRRRVSLRVADGLVGMNGRAVFFKTIAQDKHWLMQLRVPKTSVRVLETSRVIEYTEQSSKLNTFTY